MIQCPVCSHQNEDLALLCASCGSYIQERVPTLDFFATVWMMIEYPAAALKRIVIAEHKNYVLMIAMFFGISVSFALFWAVHAGNEFDNIAYLIFAATILGLVISLPLFYGITALIHGLMKLMGGKAPWRNTYAVTGWALFPFTFATAIILPIELAAFGLMFFSNNPGPFDVKPLVYSVLTGIDALLTLWSVIMLVRGLNLAHSASTWKSLVAAVVIAGFGSAFLYGIARTLFSAS